MSVAASVTTDVARLMADMGRAAKAAARVLAGASTDAKNRALRSAAAAIRDGRAPILDANRRDIAGAEQSGVAKPLVTRLRLTDARVEAMAKGLEDIAGLADPVGRTLAEWTRPNGLRISRVRTPLGVVGVAIGTALLPQLSREIRAGHDGQASQNRALELSLLLALPSAAALAVLAHPIIAVLFQRGRFGPVEAVLTADALAAFAWGLPAYVLVKTLSAGFFAREDTTTPVKIAGGALVANIVLNLALIGPFQHVGIAAATAASGWFNALCLGVFLRRRGHLVADRQLIARLPRIVAATAGMTAVIVLARYGLDGFMAGGTAARALGLALLIAIGGGAYVGLAFLFKATSRDDFRSLGRRTPSSPG